MDAKQDLSLNNSPENLHSPLDANGVSVAKAAIQQDCRSNNDFNVVIQDH